MSENQEQSIQWEGWWEEADKVESPEPYETFTLTAYGEEVGDYRNATVEDLRLAGFVPADSVKALVEAVTTLVKELHDSGLNEAREVWGNTNVNVIQRKRGAVSDALAPLTAGGTTHDGESR